MRSFTKALVLLSLVPVLLGGQSPSYANDLTASFSSLALRSSGQLLQLVSGDYGELFPEGTELAGETPILALEIGANVGPPGRILVPGTEGDARESQPLLIYDDSLDSAVMIWRRATSENSFQMDFATLRVDDNGALVWSEVFSVETEDAVVDFTVEPSLAATYDTFTLELEDGLSLETRQRTVHLVWHQGETVHYTSLSFLEGVYAGWNEVLDLTASFLQVPEGEETENASLPAEFEGFLNVTPGSDASTLLVTFANASTARLGTLALRAVPLRVSALGESVRQEIFDAADLYDPDDLSPFMEKVGGSIVIIGHRYRLHPAIIDYLAVKMDSWIEEYGAEYGLEQFTNLVEDAHSLTMDLTSSVYASTAADPFDLDGTIVEINVGGLLDGLGSAPPQFIDVEERANLAPPLVAAVPQAYTSASGEDLLLVWPSSDEEGGLDYLESHHGASWGSLRKLVLSEALGEELAYSLLEKKIR